MRRSKRGYTAVARKKYAKHACGICDIFSSRVVESKIATRNPERGVVGAEGERSLSLFHRRERTSARLSFTRSCGARGELSRVELAARSRTIRQPDNSRENREEGMPAEAQSKRQSSPGFVRSRVREYRGVGGGRARVITGNLLRMSSEITAAEREL